MRVAGRDCKRGVRAVNTSELKQTLVARACSYELAQAIADELDRLRAENARQRAWIDGVMAQKVVDAVDIGTACANLRLVDTRNREIDDALHDIEVRSVKTILRPAPFEDK